MRLRSSEREARSAEPSESGRSRSGSVARWLGATCLLAVAACAPSRPYPAGGPPPGIVAELQDSTTLWMLAIDPASVGVEAWVAGAWATYEVGVRRPGSRIRRITYKVLDREGRGTWVEVREEWGIVPTGERERPAPQPAAGPAASAPRVEHWLLPFGPVQRGRALEQLILDPDSAIRRAVYLRRPALEDRTAFPATWLWVGADTLATPGGSVPTHHYRKSATNVWVTGAIQPIGLVRAAGRGPLVNLVEWGSEGAVSSLPQVPDAPEEARPERAP